MDTKGKIIGLLKKNILVLDGAMGTELQKKGMPLGVCPEKWCIENPVVLKEIHALYQKSGADIIYTSTFGANRIKLGQYNISDVKGINKKLGALAKSAVLNKALVAGDIGPTGHFVQPFGELDFEEAVCIYKEQVRGLLAGGVDFFVIETMMDIQEARAALLAVKECTEKFVMVTMTFEKDGKTLNGTDPLSALITLQSLGADAVGCNCSTGPQDMLRLISLMKPYALVPLVAKPNAGMPKLQNNLTSFDMGPKEFAIICKKFAGAGVNMIGGCCGTTPLHINELKKTLKDRKPIFTLRNSISALSSARRAVITEGVRPLTVIGERINPTGKKELQKELLSGKFSLVRQMAKDQEKEGAEILDLNMGVPGIDEEKAVLETIGILSNITDLPLVVDSSHVKTIESALRFYPGRMLINSISGEKEKLKLLLPLAKKYGAMFILLPLTGKKVPRTLEERKKIILDIVKESRKLGFTNNDFIVDGLAMAVSSNQDAALETLNTLEWCRKELKCNTILGLSNVSFGLPLRKWLNAAFLAMAQVKGLTMAIVNPSSEELKNVKMASDVLLKKDLNAALLVAYNSRLSNKLFETIREKIVSSSGEIAQAVIEGNKEDISSLVKEELKKGTKAVHIVNKILIPAITKVGELFDKKEYFLPQLIASAETTKKAFSFLEPYLKKDKTEKLHKAVVVLATVKGDIHDIGKNIVSLMLKNHGFNVVDLGKDVSSEMIIQTAKRHRAEVIALSALMTTTMVNMKDVIRLAKERI